MSCITKMGRLKVHGTPMCGFGNWWHFLWTNGCIDLYLKDFSIGISWSPFVGFNESLWWPRCFKELSKDWSCESWAYCKHVLKKKIVWSFMFTFKTSSKWRELKRFKVDQDQVKEWIKLINTQSAQVVLRGTKWSHGMVSIVHYTLFTNPWSTWEFYVGLGMFPWACVKRKILYHPWRMTSSGDRHQVCGVQVQVEHHEEIKCLNLAIHCGVNGLVKMSRRVAHP